MYVLVMFDLPTLSKKDIKRYTKFRNSLLNAYIGATGQ